MAWVALEDGFNTHPKILTLNDAEYRLWVGLLLWAARHRTGGKLPENVGIAVVGATKSRLNRYQKAGLLDRTKDGFQIHDFGEYNGTARERTLARERKAEQRKRAKESQESHGDERDIQEDKVTDETVTKSQKSHGDVTAPSRVRDAQASQPQPQTPVQLPTVPLPDNEERPRAESNEDDDIAFDPAPARNGTANGRMNEGDIPTVLDPVAVLRAIPGGAA